MKVITTVGISILTQNYQGQFANSKDALLSDWDNERVQGEIDKFRNEDNQTNQLFPKTAQEVCAEIHTLYEIAKQNPTETLQVYLLATDTVTSVIACELMIAWLNFNKEDGDETSQRIQIAAAVSTGELGVMRQQRSIYQSAYPDAFILPIPDLQVKNPNAFQTTGFSNLLTAINAIAGTDKPILNISGGYKATIPILTIMGQIYGYPLRYTHEDSKEGQIIGLEKLPVAFDAEQIERIFPLLDEDVLPNIDPALLNEAANFGLLMPDRKKRSPLGTLFFNYVNNFAPQGKPALGVFVEYKLLEYFAFFWKDRKSYKVVRSVPIIDQNEEEKLKGNEIDLLLEPIENASIYEAIIDGNLTSGIKPSGYIACEVKPFSSFSNSTKFKKIREQFPKTCNYISSEWDKPKEFYYIVYTLLDTIPDDLLERAKDRMKRVRDEMVLQRFDISFWLVKLSIPINVDTYTNFMQERIASLEPIIL
ncbi:hypothetical protein C7N43_06830 [Sphingobacteriales bacterium UPWRP_1]|nr:hypothetical protein BVG80_13275 [Sphingobacteriales bacterium TSM_CSM]PSJ77797.1 hypothetical protein C7N43_06830 [Sphingobacteriales bacterium UPWRP_1]